MSIESLSAHLPELALAAALAWGAGLRLYAVLFLLGLSGHMGWLELPAHLRILAQPAVLTASGFMMLVEFGADKVPWLDSVWDAVHTFIRVPGGALLAAAVFGLNDASMLAIAAIAGGAISAGTHFSKAGGRAVVNTSPEPFTNWAASFSEDMLVPAGLWLALAHPLVFLVMLALFLLAAVLLIGVIARGLALVWRRVRS